MLNDLIGFTFLYPIWLVFFGILAVCVFGGFLPYAERAIRLSGQSVNIVILLLIAMILGAMFRECTLYVKESENLSWNLS